MDSTLYNQPLANSESTGYFVWEPVGKKIAIHLSGDAVDQLNLAVMRGFGAVPKRGAEVGGLLLGTVETGAKSVVRVEEFVNVPCEHLYGPSYILSEADLLAFDRELSARTADPNGQTRVVGFFRSNTREPMQLSETELALLDARFPDDDAICLLVRPFATRPSEAVFLTRDDGRFSGMVQHETFMFRRKEMNLGPAPRRQRAAATPAPRPPAPEAAEEARRSSCRARRTRSRSIRGPFLERAERRLRTSRPHAWDAGDTAAALARRRPPDRPAAARPNRPAASPLQAPAHASEIPWDIRPAPVQRSHWSWAPLSFIFLLLGILIGVGITLTINRSRSTAPNEDPYALSLSVSHFGDSFHLSWNPRLPALRQARSGELLIQEGEARKTQPLSADDLARGGIIYRGGSEPVRFRLTVFLRDRAAFSESVDDAICRRSEDRTRSGTMTGSERSGDNGRITRPNSHRRPSRRQLRTPRRPPRSLLTTRPATPLRSGR